MKNLRRGTATVTSGLRVPYLSFEVAIRLLVDITRLLACQIIFSSTRRTGAVCCARSTVAKSSPIVGPELNAFPEAATGAPVSLHRSLAPRLAKALGLATNGTPPSGLNRVACPAGAQIPVWVDK